MLNQIRADFYRLFKSKSFYLIMGIAFIFTIFMMAIYGIYSFALNNIDITELGEDTAAMIRGMLPTNFTQYMEMFYFGNYSIMFIIILMVIFCSAEYSKGYIKNTATLISPRYLTVFSKLIITVFVTAIVYLLIGIVVVGGCSIMSIEISSDNVAGIIKMLLVSFLMNVSLASFILMLFYLFRKSMPALISGILYISMGTMILAFLNLAIRAAFKADDFDITKYINLGNLVNHVSATASDSTYIRATIVALIVMAGSTAISCVSMQKKDIR